MRSMTTPAEYNLIQPNKRKNFSTKGTSLVLLWTAFVLLALASIANRSVHGLAQLSAISATQFSLPSGKNPPVGDHSDANPTENFSLTHDSSRENLIKENLEIQNHSAGLLKNSSEAHELKKDRETEVSKSNNSGTPTQLPLFQTENEPLLCTNHSGNPCFSPPSDTPKYSTGNHNSSFLNISSSPETQKPVMVDNGTPELQISPSKEAEEFSAKSMIVPSNKINQGDALDYALERTADANKTVIIITLNSAWAENGSMIDLFIESFRIGEGTKDLLDHLLIVAVDAKAYDRCVKIHPHCYILRTQGVDFSAEKTYMTQDYLKMMWRRLEFLGDILKRGYNFVFSDTDIMWLRNPLPIFSQDADFQIASDLFFGNAEDMRNRPNCGLKFVRSNNKTITFYENWYRSRLVYPGKNEQDVINILKLKTSFRKLNMKFLFLDTKNFGGFCVRSPYIDEAYTMHATCCKGLKAKIIDLRTALDEFISSKKNTTLQQHGTVERAKWSAPKACPRSWSH